ncbi:hypothetical protein CD351_00590 [Erythrobacter sp. KY5]|uniref:asparagine synthetase B family protein n=1 Tax=Erythrobacter sp. KY5 TaxID=2011159 RepID=UPI000DBEF5AD|nr:asparagine synthase-related protein [Erythrobacter sp. KY5]AWW72919.1 hypothetical protein CD351_00590 [Erythrobacter sp. KY5]
MSAIGGIFSDEDVQADQLAVLGRSLSRIPHDESGAWRGGRIALASATRHTTGESATQAQPFVCDSGKLSAVFDGYLLNPDELILDLEARGVKFSGRSEVEIALRAYEAWGDECANRMHGEFAMIVADLGRGHLFAARDHMGTVPLYYRCEAGRLIVASDFATLAALGELLGLPAMTPDRLYLAQIMANRWYLRDATPWAEIKRIVRAHTLRFDGSNITAQRYWTPPTEVTIRYKRDEDYVEHYREMLFDCVRRVLRSNREVGVAVSGGLDSSALFAIAHRLETSGQTLAPGIAAYSLAAEEGGNAFELPYARAVAAHVGRELVEVPLFDPDIEWYTADGARHMDIPTPSNGAMMWGLEERAVADGARVLINGGGGDEWLQGNELYYSEYAARGDWVKYWQALRRDADAFGWERALKRSMRFTSAELAPRWLRDRIRRRLRASRRAKDSAMNWLSPELREALADAEERYEAELPHNAVDWTKHNTATSPFSDLSHQLMRRQRSLIGVESRHPMMSRAFIEFSLRTPIDIKLRGALTKVIHRKAMAGILPDEVVWRTNKANFTNTGIDQQFAQYVRANAAEQLSEMCDLGGLETILNVDFSAPEGDYWAWEIWGLYASAAFLYQ